MPARVRIGVIGAGTMGARHARVVAADPRLELARVVDHSLQRAVGVAELAGCDPSIAAITTDLVSGAALLDGCDAVVVATPTSTHLAVALELLEQGMPLLVEKPAADTPEGLRRLLDAAEEADAALMCAFVERHNAAWLAGVARLTEPPRRVHAIRCSPPVARAEGHVAVDLMIHDLDLAMSLMGPTEHLHVVEPFIGNTHETAELVLDWPGGAQLSFVASRRSTSAQRTFVVETDAETVAINLLTREATLHRGGLTVHLSVKSSTEPLAAQFDRFLALLAGDHDPAQERRSIREVHLLAFAAAGFPSVAHR